jgi:hypothetical protein
MKYSEREVVPGDDFGVSAGNSLDAWIKHDGLK